MALGSKLCFLCLVAFALVTPGCGPMLRPMTLLLNRDEQQRVDRMWQNMTTPTDRLDRALLLDVLESFSLYQYGVDTMHFTAEKHLARGRVIMTVDCDRASPASDQFTVTVVDEFGRTLRRERYGRAEVVHGGLSPLYDYEPTPPLMPGLRAAVTWAGYSTTAMANASAMAERMKRVEAATQPAR